MVEETGASPDGQTQITPDASPDLLTDPVVVEAIAARERETEARVEAHWRAQLDETKKELGRKENNWGQERKTFQEQLEEAEVRLEAAKLSDDQEAIARRQVALTRLQREAEARKQEADQLITDHAHELALREIYLNIRETYPGLPAEFWEAAKRRLAAGEASYVIEREARAKMPNDVKVKVKPEGAGMPGEVRGTGGASNVASYRQALKDGKALPSAQEIDQITSKYR